MTSGEEDCSARWGVEGGLTSPSDGSSIVTFGEEGCFVCRGVGSSSAAPSIATFGALLKRAQTF